MNRFEFVCCLLISFAIISCSKDDGQPAPQQPLPQQGIGTPTGNYTQKVLLEYHTAAWCNTCPDADTKRDQVVNNYPGRVIPVAVHQSDAMQTPLFMALDAAYGSNPSYGMINRVASLGNVLMNRTQWMSNTGPQLNKTSKCGLAINSKVNGSSVAIEVQAAFRQNVTGDVRITVYLTENDVTGTGTGYDQANSYNNDPSSPYYNRGNPIVGYEHRYVVRKVVTASLGDPVDPSKCVPGGLLKKNFTADISGLNAQKTTVVAFVHTHGTSSTTHEVLNVQSAGLDKLKNWD
jgi:hypothetical protein